MHNNKKMTSNKKNNFFYNSEWFSNAYAKSDDRKKMHWEMVANTLVHLSTVQIRLFSNRNINRASQWVSEWMSTRNREIAIKWSDVLCVYICTCALHSAYTYRVIHTPNEWVCQASSETHESKIETYDRCTYRLCTVSYDATDGKKTLDSRRMG